MSCESASGVREKALAVTFTSSGTPPPVDFDAHFAALAAHKRLQILRLRREDLGSLHVSLRLGELLVQPSLNAF